MSKSFVLLFLLLPLLSSCAYLRIDPMNVLVRSDVIDSAADEKRILAKARLDRTEDGRVRVIYVAGSPYERGYQQGVLLRQEIKDNIGYIHDQAIKKFHFEELFDEAFTRMVPYIPVEHIEEMRGLAHGARMPLKVILRMHILADIGEWGGKKKIKDVIKQQMKGIDLGTSCSNLGAQEGATVDGKLYAVRILDWGLHRISRLHEYALITVGIPDQGVPYANIGWAGYLGSVSGMNAKGITIGEMGYGDPPGETLQGTPMPFMLRDVMTYAKDLSDVRRILRDTVGTNSYAFLMTDGKTGEGELYVKDRNRFLAFPPNTDVRDHKEHLPAIQNIVYGGHYNELMTDLLSKYRGEISPQLLMNTIIPQIIMKSNFQNVIYSPTDLQFWVSNAQNKDSLAADAPYSFFDFKKALDDYRRFLLNH